MLGDKRVMAAIPVKDVDRARGFYEGVLGLRFAGGPRADGSTENGTATLPGARAIWLKDPDGNILNVFERD